MRAAPPEGDAGEAAAAIAPEPVAVKEEALEAVRRRDRYIALLALLADGKPEIIGAARDAQLAGLRHHILRGAPHPVNHCDRHLESPVSPACP